VGGVQLVVVPLSQGAGHQGGAMLQFVLWAGCCVRAAWHGHVGWALLVLWPLPVVGAGVSFLWLEAVGVAGQCAVSRDRRWRLS
jgi:hypothetical protein